MKIKLYNREILVTNPIAEKLRYVDLPLAEEEIAYIHLAERMKFSILPVGKSKFTIKLVSILIILEINLRIYSVEIFGQPVDYFLSQLKTTKLNILKNKLVELAPQPSSNENFSASHVMKVNQPIPVAELANNKE